ncbi:MAG: hypothetical protein HYU86_06020 [Chloroflexi bacterium]|nr:hypothetical protein [Chloroflexota bacterium]
MREWLCDSLVATGAAILLFSFGLFILIMVAAVPTNNPYIGVFAFLLMPIPLVVGGVIFILGVLMSRARQRGEQP